MSEETNSADPNKGTDDGPNKAPGEEGAQQSSDLATVYEQSKKAGESAADDKAGEDGPNKGAHDGGEVPYLALGDTITDPKVRETYGHHVKGVQKRERQIQEREDALGDVKTDAEFYRKNKADIDELLQIKKALNDPETGVETAKRILSQVEGTHDPFVPDLDTDKEMVTFLTGKIDALEQRFEGRISKHDEDRDSRNERTKLAERAKSTFEDTAAEVARTCHGYKVSEADHLAALKAKPLLSEVEAVRLHCFDGIQKQTASTAAQPSDKTTVIIDGADRTSPLSTPTASMTEAYAQMKATGAVKAE